MDNRMNEPGRILAVGGMSFALVWALAHLALNPSSGPFTVVPAIVAGTLAAVCWYRGPRWRYLTGVIGVLMLLGIVLSDINGLSRIESVLDFSLIWASAVGAVFAIVAAVVTATGSRIPARSMVATATVALVGLTLVSAIITLTGRNTLSDAELGGAVAVRAIDSVFSSEEIAISSTGVVRLALINDGRVYHTFTSDLLDVDEELAPGRQRIIEVTIPDDAQTIHFYCKPHSAGSAADRSGMVGVMTVQ